MEQPKLVLAFDEAGAPERSRVLGGYRVREDIDEANPFANNSSGMLGF